jgi:hypothetical protein
MARSHFDNTGTFAMATDVGAPPCVESRRATRLWIVESEECAGSRDRRRPRRLRGCVFEWLALSVVFVFVDLRGAGVAAPGRGIVEFNGLAVSSGQHA